MGIIRVCIGCGCWGMFENRAMLLYCASGRFVDVGYVLRFFWDGSLVSVAFALIAIT